MPADGNGDAVHRRIFRFANAVFDEGSQELSVDGALRPLEAKPRMLLSVLLSQANMVVSKTDLKHAVWPEKKFVEEGSLTTAVYSLRAALEPNGRAIIKSVPGLGYQIAAKVEVSFIEPPPMLRFALSAGDKVPGRPQWMLERPLSVAPAADVWLARHEKTPEWRVFKFAETAERLDALKREAALSRILQAKLGAREDIVRVLEWNFETHPYFIELPYGGRDVPAWMAGAAGAACDMAARVALVTSAARTLAAAHGAGVLHGDIKPANILVADEGDSAARIRLVDFGAGGLTESTKTEWLTVTLQSLADRGAGLRSGTLLYVAPELIRGGPPTVAADIYALGILLYQMIVGDFTRPLTAGWERDVQDPLLRQDIAAAAAGDPALRLPSAASLADRLQTLEARRAAEAHAAALAAEAAGLAERVRQNQLRRPWIILAMVTLAAGVVATSGLALRVVQERDAAQRQTGIAQAVNLFLTDDLLGRGNPANSGKANETLMEAATQAEPRIAFRLPTEPLVAASIYLSLAQAFDSRSAYAEARGAYGQAISAFEKAEGGNSADATIARLKWARMEVMAGEAGSLQRARALIARAEPGIPGLGKRAAEARVWLLGSKGTLEMTGGSVPAAQQAFKHAADLADTMPDIFDPGTRLGLRQREAAALFRQGQWDKADALLNDLLRRQLALHGPLHPDTLLVRLTLAQVMMGRGDAQAAATAIDQLKPDLVTVFGPTHRMVLQALSVRARASGLLGHYDDAIRDDMDVYRATVAKQGEDSQFAIYPLNDVAESQCRAGHTDDGIANARRAYAIAARVFRATPAIPQAVSAQVAFCLIRAKQFAEAKSILDSIDRRAVSQLIGDPDVDAGIDLMLADIASASGNKAQARLLLRAPLQAFDRANADPFTRDWVRELQGVTKQ